LKKGIRTIDLLLAYYGDDFTGSTDVLEALASGGIAAVLFVGPPSDELLNRYSHVRAVGIAGNSRTMSPGQMDQTLPEAFGVLRKLQPRFVHYKVCSTFDSSPEVGSIGRAIDIGHEVFQNRLVPLVVGAPSLGRYCLFGNLFAKSGLGSAPYRLDRHPTMQQHPVTPMTEADLRVHLSEQTQRSIELVDVLALERGYEVARTEFERARQTGTVVLFDTLTDNHLEIIGELICDEQDRERKPQFVAGSSGACYALVKYWQNLGIAHSASDTGAQLPEVAAVDQVVVVSGSCSPVTGRQIGWALEHGFAEVPVDPSQFGPSKACDANVSEYVTRIVRALGDGKSVVVHTHCGRIGAAEARRELGVQLGCMLRESLRAHPVQRVAVVGGDTSGQVARSLEIEAIEIIGPLEPGAPLCVARSRDRAIGGLEITFKGGQVGYDDFFGTLVSGRSSHAMMGARV
jgi:3-oxoisoapionate kinase